jgi:methionyl-tRNA formyltransferase
MQMEPGLDSGPVLHQIETEVAADETGGELTERLAELGAGALIEALTLMDAGEQTAVAQDHTRATWAPKINRETARLDWSRDAATLARTTRAFDPEPGAWARLADAEVKLFGGRVANASGEPGTVIAAGDSLVIATSVGALEVSEVQPSGKKRMPVSSWVNGRGVNVGDRFA